MIGTHIINLGRSMKVHLTLYKWAPVAEELKNLDRKIVLNSMILKWDNIER